MIHNIALYGSAAITGLLFVGILIGLEGLAAKALTNHEMCTEVTAIAQDAVDSGDISQFEADQISQRCFDIPEDHD